MSARLWHLPITASSHRATVLESLSYGQEGLTLHLVEETQDRRWCLRFPEVHAFRCTAEESAAQVIATLPRSGAFFDIPDSRWLTDLGRDTLEYMSDAKHYLICCYEEVVEVVATDYTIYPA